MEQGQVADRNSVFFGRSGRGGVYQYFDVPAEVHRGLMAAESHGRYFNQHVRDKGYRFRRMN